MNNYYTIPLDTRVLKDKNMHPRCDLKESIRMNIHLIIRTHLNEYRYDGSYGCLIWNKDYSTVTNVSNWKDELRDLISLSVEKNEPRLKAVDVRLHMEDAEITEQLKKQPLKLKKKITIKISGNIKHLNEPFEHFEYLFFSPLSLG